MRVVYVKDYSTYMHVLEGVKEDSNVILFKQELYEESTRKFEKALNTSEKGIVIICSFPYIYIYFQLSFIKLD